MAMFFRNLPLGLAPGIGLSAYLTYGLILGTGLSVHEAFTSVCSVNVNLIRFIKNLNLFELIYEY